MSNSKYKPIFYFSMTLLAPYALWFAGAYAGFQEDIIGLHMLKTHSLEDYRINHHRAFTALLITY